MKPEAVGALRLYGTKKGGNFFPPRQSQYLWAEEKVGKGSKKGCFFFGICVLIGLVEVQFWGGGNLKHVLTHLFNFVNRFQILAISEYSYFTDKNQCATNRETKTGGKEYNRRESDKN